MEITAQTELYTTIGTIVALIVTIVGFAIRMTSLKDKLEFRMETAEKLNCDQNKEIENLKLKANNTDVAFMEIRTKLANIETLLMDMKNQIKNK